MECRGAQRNGCHSRTAWCTTCCTPASRLRRCSTRRPPAQRQVADAGGRRRLRHEPLAGPVETAPDDVLIAFGMTARRCPRAGSPLRAVIPVWDGNRGSVAAPHRGRRPAVAGARGDVEIYRPPRMAARAAHLLHGCKNRFTIPRRRHPLNTRAATCWAASPGPAAAP